MRAAEAAVTEAKRKVADARASNPMFRVAAAWQRTPVENLTSEQFEAVKHWAIIALAAATALSTALAAIISSLPERGARPGKLARAFRATLAAVRKRVRRTEARTVFVDRIVRVHVPVDPQTGLPVDRRAS
jgi:hypothetical protein